MPDIPQMQRPAFFDGQRLSAADLSSAQSFHRELRWLHHRSLHNWGIAFGLAVTGKRKQRSVQVQPGYALDCDGRELILSEALDMPVPAVSGTAAGEPVVYYLTASYLEDAAITPETRAGICDTLGAVRRPEGALIRWQEPNEAGFRFGLDVVLASIEVKDCQLHADVSGAVRRDAVPAQQPYIAAGQTDAGATLWRLWPDAGQPAGVATTVSTTGAGFRATPRYQAHVIGDRVFNTDVIIDGYAQVAQPGAFSFDLIVVLPQGTLQNRVLNPPGMLTPELLDRLNSNDLQKQGMGWFVVWMGVEG